MSVEITRSLCHLMSYAHIISVNPHVWNVHSGEKNLGNRLIQLRKQIIPQRNQPPLTNSSKGLLVVWLASASTPPFFSDCTLLLTCFWCNPFPLSLRSILLNPTPIAPEDTKTTRCPWVRSFTTVSTIDERSRRWGTKGYVGDTIDEVPGRELISHQYACIMDLPSLMTIVRGVNFDLPCKAESQQTHDSFESSSPTHSRTCW